MSEAGNPVHVDRYGGAQVRRGLAHFLLGKAMTSIAGIGTFILLVRVLPLEEFAAYSILYGLIDLIAAITGVGIVHVMARYVPEVYATNLNQTFRHLITGLFALRFVVLAGSIAFMYLFSSSLSDAIGLADWTFAFEAYLWVVLIRTVIFTLFTVLEQMLLQGIAQFGFSAITIVRFVVLAALASNGVLDLMTVIYVEIITDLIGSILMAVGLIRRMPAATTTGNADDSGWIRRNARRMADFGLKGYVQHMLVLPFGGSTDRLIVGSQLAAGQVALFGFGQWILDLMARYLPAQLLQGMIRPVLTARYARNGQFGDVVILTNLLLKINFALLAAFMVMIHAGGGAILALISKDKFGDQALNLLYLMTVIMALASWRNVLDIATSTVEQNGPLIYAHTVLILSVIPGVLALPWLGIYALPVSHVFGLIAASFLLMHRLGKAGFHYRMNWSSLGSITAITVLTMVLTEWMRPYLIWPWLIGVSLTILTALLLLSRPLAADERDAIAEILHQQESKA